MSGIYEKKQEITDIFLGFFLSNNYDVVPQVELVTDDDSLLFTNDTIVPWKHYLLRNPIPSEGVCMRQPCVRLRGINDPLTKDAENERTFERYIGYFNSLGILVDGHKREVVQNHVIDLLVSSYGIAEDDIRIFATEDMQFVDILRERFVVTDNGEEKSYFCWKYGIDGVQGSGATVALLQEDGSYEEIGQLIEIRDKEGVVAYEFGFGLETFISRKERWKTYDAWTITQTLPDRLRFKSLLDIYSCFGAVCTVPHSLLRNRHIRETRRIARKVATLESLFDVPHEVTVHALNEFIHLEFGLDHGSRLNEELRRGRQDIKDLEEGYRWHVRRLSSSGCSQAEMERQAKDRNDSHYRLPSEIAGLICKEVINEQQESIPVRERLLTEPNFAFYRSLSAEEKALVERIRQEALAPDCSSSDLQDALYAIPKVLGMSKRNMRAAQRNLFRLVYQLVLGKNEGPRLSSLLIELTPAEIQKLLDFRNSD